ncbi:hypothetical protein UAY_02732 [Enterococcus moraviensis ATCC BAA-383]|uniref:Uncharacterized protein n=1 Tax=Enterococcus moraviensis ATCC BAA-383 TaxID=1158609 RepID=R2SP79_9ENTE|nr:DUF916 and DUF3324 domain-containing protein [Enterococcus moraviensis]EOH97000.1 hypothetical protein UAY_02732 [Enterococcus moraviensis ATCC BAA-383]EOT65790.1 hypothetical protein I586_02059 [Enterococcus moraviensis ATCC BAA-383]
MKEINKLRFYFMLIFVIGLCFFSNFQQVAAEEENNGFSVKAILPENQRNKEVTYYDLEVKPGQEQDLSLELFNSSSNEQELSLAINPAITNDNGVIDYSTLPKSYQYDASLRTPITTIASTDKKVKVPANSKKIVKIHLKLPNEKFKGMILGGIYITSLTDDTEDSDKKETGMQIKNKIAYTIGMTLVESNEEVKADLQYEKTTATQEAGRNIVKATIRNPQPINLDDISYQAKIYKEGSTEVIHERTVEGYRMAPQSVFNYPISWNNKPFKAGKYQIKLTAESKKTGQKWNWDETFTIKADEAKKLNEKAVDLEEDNQWMMYLIAGGILLLVLILVLIIVYVVKRKRKKEREAKKLAARKKAKKRNKQKVSNSNKDRKEK